LNFSALMRRGRRLTRIMVKMTGTGRMQAGVVRMKRMWRPKRKGHAREGAAWARWCYPGNRWRCWCWMTTTPLPLGPTAMALPLVLLLLVLQQMPVLLAQAPGMAPAARAPAPDPLPATLSPFWPPPCLRWTAGCWGRCQSTLCGSCTLSCGARVGYRVGCLVATVGGPLARGPGRPCDAAAPGGWARARTHHPSPLTPSPLVQVPGSEVLVQAMQVGVVGLAVWVLVWVGVAAVVEVVVVVVVVVEAVWVWVVGLVVWVAVVWVAVVAGRASHPLTPLPFSGSPWPWFGLTSRRGCACRLRVLPGVTPTWAPLRLRRPSMPTASGWYVVASRTLVQGKYRE
jgi:hypothetical protein